MKIPSRTFIKNIFSNFYENELIGKILLHVLFCSVYFWTSLTTFCITIIVLNAIYAIFKDIKRKNTEILKTLLNYKIIYYGLFICLIAIIGLFHTPDVSHGLWVCKKYLRFSLLLFFVYYIIRTKINLNSIFEIFFTCTIIMITISVILVIIDAPKQIGSLFRFSKFDTLCRIRSCNSIDISIYLSTLMLYFILFFLKKKQHLNEVDKFYIIPKILLLCLLIFLYSKASAFLCIFIYSGLTVCNILICHKKYTSLMLLSLSILCFCIFNCAYINKCDKTYKIHNNLYYKFINFFYNKAIKTPGRMNMSIFCIKSFLKSPYIGHGTGSFGDYAAKSVKTSFGINFSNNLSTLHPHNDLFHFMFQWGIFGIVSFILWYSWLFRYFLRFCKKYNFEANIGIMINIVFLSAGFVNCMFFVTAPQTVYIVLISACIAQIIQKNIKNNKYIKTKSCRKLKH